MHQHDSLDGIWNSLDLAAEQRNLKYPLQRSLGGEDLSLQQWVNCQHIYEVILDHPAPLKHQMTTVERIMLELGVESSLRIGCTAPMKIRQLFHCSSVRWI